MVNHEKNILDALVRCPIPGKAHLPPQRLGDFMQTEIGQQLGEQIVSDYEMKREKGIEEEEAMALALGFAAVRNKDGTIATLPDPAIEQADLTPRPLESKKK